MAIPKIMKKEKMMKRKKNENLIRSMNGHIIQRAEEGQGDSRQVQLSFSSEDPYKRL